MNKEIIDPRVCVNDGDYREWCPAEICVGACGFTQEDGDHDNEDECEEESHGAN